MANASDWLEGVMASHILGSGTFSKPSVIAIALCRNVPTDAQTGATIPEVSNANAYARQTLNPSSSNWTDPVGVGGAASNLSAITFPANTTADWGWVSGVAILDSATHGAGNVLFQGAVTTPKLVQVGDQYRFSIGSLSITFA